jgi:hypothetical protein
MRGARCRNPHRRCVDRRHRRTHRRGAAFRPCPSTETWDADSGALVGWSGNVSRASGCVYHRPLCRRRGLGPRATRWARERRDGSCRVAVTSPRQRCRGLGDLLSPLQRIPRCGRGACRIGSRDNAAYRRDTLERHSASFADGFWEVDFHRRLRRENGGTRLEFIPGADAQFGPSSSFAPLARQRFAHGRHWGAWRVEQGVRSAWQVVVAAPLVPLVLGARIARRVLRRPSHRVRFVLSLPVVLALAAAWAAGEAVGALSVIGMGTERRQGVAA